MNKQQELRARALMCRSRRKKNEKEHTETGGGRGSRKKVRFCPNFS